MQTFFGLSASYDIKPWFTTTLNYNTLSFFPDSDGSFENFFYNENTTVSLTFTLRIDGLYASVRTPPE